VIIENKLNISDPEGDTILNDLVLKGNNSSVKKIRVGKILKFTVEASDKKKAEKIVEINLTKEEKKEFIKSVNSVKEILNIAKKII